MRDSLQVLNNFELDLLKDNLIFSFLNKVYNDWNLLIENHFFEVSPII